MVSRSRTAVVAPTGIACFVVVMGLWAATRPPTSLASDLLVGDDPVTVLLFQPADCAVAREAVAARGRTAEVIQGRLVGTGDLSEADIEDLLAKNGIEFPVRRGDDRRIARSLRRLGHHSTPKEIRFGPNGRLISIEDIRE